MTVEDILKERGKTYGNFAIQAAIACELKTVMWQHVVWNQHLAPDMREALEMIAVKVARILNGNPRYADNWADIAGYATLVVQRLEEENATHRESEPMVSYSTTPIPKKARTTAVGERD